MPVFPFLQATQIRFIEHRSRREDGKKNTKEQLQAKGAVACTLSLVQTTVFKRSKAVVGCIIPVPVQYCAFCSDSAVLCDYTA
jgi:hypothetical protein